MKKFLSILALVLCVCLCGGAALAEEPVLLAYYTFNDAANLGADASGSGNDLVRSVNPDGISVVEGVSGDAAYFGGSSGLLAADDANNDFIDTMTGKSLTISYWAKADIANYGSGQRRVVDQGVNGSAEGVTNVIGVDGGTVFNIAVAGGTDWWSGYGAVQGDPAGWHHYVMVLDNDANTLTTYIDGVKCAEVYAEDETIASAFTFCVGGNWAQWDWFNNGNRDVTVQGFVGAVDEVKVYAGAVYDMDLLAAAADAPVSTRPVADYSTYRYNGTVEEVTREEIVYHPTNGLEAWYEFDDAAALGKDSTGNGHDLDRQINAAGIGTAVGADGTTAVTFAGSSALTTGEESAQDFVDKMPGSLTISFYAQSEHPTAGMQRVIDNGMNGSSDGFTIMINNEGGRLATLTPTGNHWWDTYSDTWASAEVLSDWHHYTVVYDAENGTMTTYVDGTKKLETALNGSENHSSGFSFAVGGQWSQYDWFSGGDSAIEGFKGAVDDVKIFNAAVHDKETIDNAGLGEEKITITETVMTPFKNEGYVNNTVCVMGPAFRDFIDPVTGKWYTFCPIDLTVSGSRTYPIIGGGAWIIGDVTVTVDGDQLTANYRYYQSEGDDTSDLSQYLNFFNDFDAITAEQLENGAETPFRFGEVYSISSDLGGATQTLLYLCNRATFFTNNTAISRYWPNSKYVKPGIDAMVESLGLSDRYTK